LICQAAVGVKHLAFFSVHPILPYPGLLLCDCLGSAFALAVNLRLTYLVT